MITIKYSYHYECLFKNFDLVLKYSNIFIVISLRSSNLLNYTGKIFISSSFNTTLGNGEFIFLKSGFLLLIFCGYCFFIGLNYLTISKILFLIT